MSIVFDYDSIAKHRNNPNYTERDKKLVVLEAIIRKYHESLEKHLAVKTDIEKGLEIILGNKNGTFYKHWNEIAQYLMDHGFHI